MIYGTASRLLHRVVSADTDAELDWWRKNVGPQAGQSVLEINAAAVPEDVNSRHEYFLEQVAAVAGPPLHSSKCAVLDADGLCVAAVEVDLTSFPGWRLPGHEELEHVNDERAEPGAMRISGKLYSPYAPVDDAERAALINEMKGWPATDKVTAFKTILQQRITERDAEKAAAEMSPGLETP
ncbi:MAG: hypothetical protein IT514_15370 [Burkholderiales bacterium]|nr:hypothetical protein [Burkholderiales bacterium]